MRSVSTFACLGMCGVASLGVGAGCSGKIAVADDQNGVAVAPAPLSPPGSSSQGVPASRPPPGAPPGPTPPPPTSCGLGTVEILGTASFPMGLAIDDTGAYFSSDVSGVRQLGKLPLKAGGALSILGPPRTDGASIYGDVAVDGTNVYWVTGPSGFPGLWSVDKLAPGTPLAIAPEQAIGYMAADESALFYGADYAIHRVATGGAGGPPSVVAGEAHEHPLAIVMDSANVFYLTINTDSAVYSLRAVAKSGGPVTVLAAMPGVFGSSIRPSIAEGRDSLYFTDGNAHIVAKVAKAGGPVTPLTTAPFPAEIVVGGGFAYYLDIDPDTQSYGALQRIPVGGGSPTTIAKVKAAPTHGLVYRAGRVYIATAQDVRAITVCDAN